MRMMSSFVDMGDTDSDFNGDDEEGRERVRSGKSVQAGPVQITILGFLVGPACRK